MIGRGAELDTAASCSSTSRLGDPVSMRTTSGRCSSTRATSSNGDSSVHATVTPSMAESACLSAEARPGVSSTRRIFSIASWGSRFRDAIHVPPAESWCRKFRRPPRASVLSSTCNQRAGGRQMSKKQNTPLTQQGELSEKDLDKVAGGQEVRKMGTIVVTAKREQPEHKVVKMET